MQIFSIPAISLLVALSAAQPAFMPSVFKRDLNLTTTASQCDPSKAELSCLSDSSLLFTNITSADSGSCCLETQGLMLQTQFWDTDVPGSPENTWTIHGLWPDKCDGSYDANCGFSKSVNSVSSVLKEAGETELVDYMEKYWLNNNGNNDKLYTHEFNKHGTCMTTIASKCYPEDAPANANVVDFAKLVVKTYQGLPTYKWLADAGITPSSSKTYKASDVEAALEKGFGKKVYIGCKGGKFNEVWYFHKVKGSLLEDDLVKVDAVSSSTCSGNIKYPPRSA